MEFLGMEKVKDGKYLKNYELIYINKAGKEKHYEIVSRHEIQDASDLGNHVSGVSIVATYQEKLLLLKEYHPFLKFLKSFCLDGILLYHLIFHQLLQILLVFLLPA